MSKYIGFFIIINAYNSLAIVMEKKPYHYLPDETFQNPEGSPVRFKDTDEKFGFKKGDTIIFKVGKFKKIKNILE